MSRSRVLRRGLAKRCPHCGARAIFRSFFELHEHCPSCGLRFEREDGYWLGAMVVAMAVTEVVFVGLLVVAIAATWPDVPWGWVLAIGLVTNAVIPVVGYPRCKTAWLGMHLAATDPTIGDGTPRDAQAAGGPGT